MDLVYTPIFDTSVTNPARVEELKEGFRSRIVALRERLNLSKNAFAKSIGYDSTNYGRLEKNGGNPTLVTLINIYVLYGINLHELITGERTLNSNKATQHSIETKPDYSLQEDLFKCKQREVELMSKLLELERANAVLTRKVAELGNK